MHIKHLTLGIATLLMLSGCYRSITTTVVDAETGQPIEGAVILAEWTTTRGMGDTATDSYKVVEAVSDRDGRITIAGNILNPLVQRPSVTVYKKGYVAWNNEYIFPGWQKRKDYKWKNGYVFRLERFKEGYSYDEHQNFVGNAIHTNLDTKDKQLFLKVYRESEEKKAFDERNRKRKEGKW